jgi:nicotinate-nucleotide--dimethylbenzimidazole phosphoribosyltransferase
MPADSPPRSADELRRTAVDALARKTKPPGSLGRLELLAVELAVLGMTLAPRVDRPRILVFAADHGLAHHGTSAYPREVTAQMMRNFATGGAAISVLCRSAGVELEVIDVGVDADLDGVQGIVGAKVRRGSRDVLSGPAMSEDELDAALEAGRSAVRRALDAGADAVGLGEMGIGNTASASLLASALLGLPLEATVGPGTGLDAEGVARKRRILAEVLARHDGAGRFRNPSRARQALACLGGLEIGALAGAMLEAASRRLPVVVDGFIVTVAALVAVRIEPAVREALFFAHRSVEPGHGPVLDALEASPLLDLGLRLGEGTGAVLALPLLRAAAAILREMATFESAGVSERDGAAAGSH